MDKKKDFHYESDGKKIITTDELEAIKSDESNGIDLIILIKTDTLQATVLRNFSKGITLEDLYRDGKIHNDALQEVLKNGFLSYDWSIEKNGKQFLFQSTLVPLFNNGKRTKIIVALARDITLRPRNLCAKKINSTHCGEATRISQLLLAVREAEKKEIAKALHDEIGSFSVLSMSLLKCAKSKLQNGEQAKALNFLGDLDEHLREEFARLRNIIVSLRPPALETDGALGDSIHILLENISQFIHIPYKFDYIPTIGIEVGSEVRIVIYRAVQEALSNIVKHAKAKNIYVLLERHKGFVRVVIQDDGVGFVPTTQQSMKHLGLFGMKDSVLMIGGKINITSSPGKGTRIEVKCPNMIKEGK